VASAALTYQEVASAGSVYQKRVTPVRMRDTVKIRWTRCSGDDVQLTVNSIQVMLRFNISPNPGLVTIMQPLKAAKSKVSPRRLASDLGNRQRPLSSLHELQKATLIQCIIDAHAHQTRTNIACCCCCFQPANPPFRDHRKIPNSISRLPDVNVFQNTSSLQQSRRPRGNSLEQEKGLELVRAERQRVVRVQQRQTK
jgi:hypothetical protein